jgi:hypothetical protein
MRSVVANKLRKDFKKYLSGKYPNFKEDRESIKPPGFQIYRYKLSEEFSFFIELNISPKQDEYWIEFGWREFKNHEKRLFTLLDNSSNTEEAIEELVQKDKVSIRLGRIFEPNAQTDKGYIVGLDWRKIPDDVPLYLIEDIPVEDALRNSEESLIDVMYKIDTYVIPCFKRVTEKRGYAFEE